jgi:hypothetical protein
MTTATQEQATPVEGTRFRLVPVEVTWGDGGPRDVEADPDDSRDLATGHMEYYLGDDEMPQPRDLPVCRNFEESAVLWTVQHVLHPDGRFPKLWRRADAEYLARQLHAACPAVWAIEEWRAFRSSIPDGVSKWLRLVPPLLNRGVPQELLVGCRAFVEATR